MKPSHMSASSSATRPRSAASVMCIRWSSRRIWRNGPVAAPIGTSSGVGFDVTSSRHCRSLARGWLPSLGVAPVCRSRDLASRRGSTSPRQKRELPSRGCLLDITGFAAGMRLASARGRGGCRWQRADSVDEEGVGETVATPDWDVVDEIGRALRRGAGVGCRGAQLGGAFARPRRAPLAAGA